jgi:hypothetical protein
METEKDNLGLIGAIITWTSGIAQGYFMEIKNPIMFAFMGIPVCFGIYLIKKYTNN